MLVGPGVFTQRWVLTLGTGCSSRADASGAARLIGASGRSSEGTGPLGFVLLRTHTSSFMQLE